VTTHFDPIAEILAELDRQDSALTLTHPPYLPAGVPLRVSWNGVPPEKQTAFCNQMAKLGLGEDPIARWDDMTAESQADWLGLANLCDPSAIPVWRQDEHRIAANADPDTVAALAVMPVTPLLNDNGPSPEEVVRRLSAGEDAGEHPLEVSSWEPVELGPVLRGERVTVQPSVLARDDGVHMLYPGRLNAAIGETESLKSWFACLAIKSELNAGHHVVYIDFEDTPETAVERLGALGTQAENIATHFTYIQPDGTFDEIAKLMIGEVIGHRGVPTLVVIDGVTEAMSLAGLDPKDGPPVSAFYASFPRLFARMGAAVLLTDHVTKSSEGRGRWAIGSERKLSGLDGVAYQLNVTAAFGRGRTGKARITVSKDRCGHIRQHEAGGKVITVMELESRADGGVTGHLHVPDQAGSVDGVQRPTKLMERLSKLITDHPGLTQNSLKEAVGGKREYLKLALQLLIDEEYVEVRIGPNRSRQHFPLKSFIASQGTVADAAS
jgi:hypothetical protein